MLQTVLIVVSLGLTAVTVAVVGKAVLSMLAVIRRGEAAPGRAGNPVGRTLTMLKETFGHTRMLQWTWVGIMHWFVFAAFLFLSTAVAAAYFQLFDAEFVWPFVGHFYPYEWFSEIIGLLSTIGVIVLIIYRQKHHPRTEGRDSRFYGSRMWQAYFVEFLALFEGGAILFVRGAEYNLLQATGHTEHATRAHFPIASWVGDVLYPNGAGDVHTLENIIYAIATFKIVLAMVWLLIVARNLTMGIAWHRFTAWFNIWFKREDSGRTALGAVKPLTSGGKPITLDDVDDLDEDAMLGAGSIWDFSWKDILDFTTCTECGRCQSQCPAWNTEKPLSPKLMIMALREEAFAAGGRPDGEENRALVGKAEHDQSDGVQEYFYYPEDGDFVVDEDALWACTNCGACVQQCPVDIEHVDHFVDMRRYQVLVESNFPSELNGLFKGLENKGNPWNMSPTARLDWAKDLPFEVKVVGDQIEDLESVDWLFWVGCAGGLLRAVLVGTRAVAELLDLAGVSFGVLGNGETCTGDSARRAGNEFVFQGLAQQNIEVLTEAKAKKVVSTCPHCMNTLKNEYRQLGIELEVIHHTQLLNRLVREGKLTPVADGAGAHDRKITYHDPCFLGRHNNVYTPPRDLLEILPGAEFAEMERAKEKSFCCGAGGARMWMEETIGERINLNRTAEAVGTGADQVAVGCPFCRVMLSDGLTKMQADGEAREEVEVLDVAQMLLASVKGEQATKLLPGQGAPIGAAGAGAGAAAGAAAKSVETKAEPEQGDVTVTENTVVDTEDAGPAAKASGGSSMFDDPGSMFDEPAAAPTEKAAPAEEKPAEAKAAPEPGGSLFDDSSSLFDTPAEAPTAKAAPAEEKPAAAQKPAAEKPAEAASDLGGGGSLFDIGGDETPAAAAAPAPAKEEPKPQAKEEPKAAPAEEKPAADLGGGGSLFDIPAQEPAPAAPAAPAAAEEKPAEEPAEPAAKEEPAPKPTEEQVVEAEVEGGVAAAAPRPAASIPEDGSLFDIAAPEPAARTSSAPAPESATPASDASPVDAPVPGATDEAAPVDENAREEEAAAATSAAPPTAASESPVPEEEAAEPGATEVEALEEELAAAEDDETPVTDAAPKAEPAEAESAEAEPAEESKPAAQPAPKGSGEAHQPKTDVDINESGSLFDL
jgi:Fe-S oxidoreductase